MDKNKGGEQKRRILLLIMTYSKTTKKLTGRLKRNYHKHTRGQAIEQQYRMVVAYKRGKNLGDYLVQSRLSKPNEKQKKGIVRRYVRGVNGKVFKLSQIIPLNKSNCIYLISCHTCGMRYVGETKNSYGVRMAAHMYAIRKEVTGKGQSFTFYEAWPREH